MNAAQVDNMLRRYGDVVTLKRTGVADLPLRAAVSGYRAADLANGVVQGDREVRIGTAEILAAGWPGPPKRHDIFVIAGQPTVIQTVDTRTLGDADALHVCRVRG